MQRTERKNQDLESEVRNMKRFLLCGVLLALLAGSILLLGRLGRGGRRRSLLAESRCGTAKGASAAEALGGVSIHEIGRAHV